MRRLFLWIALLAEVLGLAGLAGAVPVRPAGMFGEGGSLTREELDRLPVGEPAGKDADEPEDLRQPGPKGEGKLALGLHLPRTDPLFGEPIWAYFLVRNNHHDILPLDLRFEFHRSPPLVVNSVRIKIVNRADGTTVAAPGGGMWRCGGPPLAAVPGRGYYCGRLDLNTGDTAPLPPGEYACTWRSGARHSNTVAFVVRDNPRPAPWPPAPRRHHAFVAMDGPDEARPGGDGAIVWEKPHLAPRDAGEVGAALGVGVAGKYYPDLRDLPQRDDRLAASAEWHFGPAGDRVRVTLAPVDRRRDVRLPRCHLMLQIEAEQGHEREMKQLERPKEMAERLAADPQAPRTIDVRLPRDWHRHHGLSGRARVAVVVSSEDLEPPDPRLSRLNEMSDRQPRWAGVLRTPFREVTLPAVERTAVEDR